MPRSPLRVLLLEPHRDNRDMYVEYLRISGCEVVAPEDCSAPAALLHGIDAVVTGIRFPGGLDGLQIVREIRANIERKSLPIIVLSACALTTDREAAMAAGCSAFLAKPCLPSTLLEEIRRLVTDARLAAASSRRPATRMLKAPPSAPPVPRAPSEPAEPSHPRPGLAERAAGAETPVKKRRG